MEIAHPHTKINNADHVNGIFRAILDSEDEIDRKKEHFWVMGLNTNKGVEYIELVSLGIVNRCLIHPRETFRLAITKAVDAIILCHNHPSSNVSPSSHDKTITDQLVDAGKILGIEVIDHIIIGTDSQFFSFLGEDIL